MEIKSPKVSIILPCYNVEKYIAKSIQSVLNQTFIDFELLVIIDGSPDNSKQVAETFSDSRISIYEKQNGGLSDARNFGLERAKGEFIYFMDSDDWIEPNLLNDTINILEIENLDLIVFGYFLDNENHNGDLINSTEIVSNVRCFNKFEKISHIDVETLGILGYAWNKVYKKSFLDSNNLIFEKGTSLIEDILFNVAVYEKCSKVRFLNKAYYHYLNRPIQTLIKQFHSNSFLLKKRRTLLFEKFLNDWNVEHNAKNKIIGYMNVQGVRYCIHNLFSFKNNLTFQEKNRYVKYMIEDDTTIRFIDYYKPTKLLDKIYKILIKKKCHLTLTIIATIIK